MPKSEAQRVMEAFRLALLEMDRQAASLLVNAYLPIWARLRSEITALLETAEAEGLSAAQVFRLQRMRDLEAQVLREVGRFADQATFEVNTFQRRAVTLAREAAIVTANAALPAGLTMPALAQFGLEWNALPAEAFEAFIGISGDGKPLGKLFDTLGPEARVQIRSAIAEGIALGQSPRKTAAIVRQRAGISLTRALTISRTETLRAFREASRAQYQENSRIVKGYERRSARDGSVCPACLALDGEEYETNSMMPLHVNDRCVLIPRTVTYRDLGIDVDEPPSFTEGSRDWFRGQPENVQRGILGPGRFGAWKAGDVRLEDMAKVTHDPVWGDQAGVRPLKELIGA